MSQQNLTMFFEAMARDESLRARFEAIGARYRHQDQDESVRDEIWENEILPLARSKGFEFTLEDLKTLQAAQSPKADKLTDDELDAVVGGGCCTCVWVGGGTRGDGDSRCICVVMGMGFTDDHVQRCICGNWGSGG